MPKFVEYGPHIPEDLLEAHEQGKVVFVCGAGVSYPADLPSFKDLVEYLYARLAPTRSKVQELAMSREQYDRAISLLERDLPEGRKRVRRAVVARLTPNLELPGALTTHESLLVLGTTRNGEGRIVTTNFDRLFETVIKNRGLTMQTFAAPQLPVAKKRLDGLVYLHGRIDDPATDSALRNLVLSSGDFGLAYITEGWGARFVTELFRNYRICFVGYSIDDPVMRYVMDALAADQQMGETQNRIYAFAGCAPGTEAEAMDDWDAKNVAPILYSDADNHAVLHQTLQAWANYYSIGLKGRTAMLEEHARTKPLSSSKYDYAVGRVLWALTDERAARYFSEMNPAPPLEWLEPLDNRQFGHEDLSLFHVTPNAEVDKDLKFSFMRRPTPYTHAPMMLLVNYGNYENGIDKPMEYIGAWLVRHLNNPRLLMWMARWGSHMHGYLGALIRERLTLYDRLEADPAKKEEFEQLRANSPDGHPSAPMRALWELFINGRVKQSAHNNDMYAWRGKFKSAGFSAGLRFELRELLTPMVVIRDKVEWPVLEESEKAEAGPARIKDIVDWDIALKADSVHSAMRDIFQKEEWLKFLPDFLPDATLLLKDAMDLRRALGGAEDVSDLTYMHQPSVSEHRQNCDFHDWTGLIEIVRDGWVGLSQREGQTAIALATAVSWFQTQYPVFKRLAFFAAAQPGTPVPASTALDWLSENDGWWLWSVEAQREVMRLIVSLAPRLIPEERDRFEKLVFNGPPRRMFKTDLSDKDWAVLVDQDIWHRLAKYEFAGTLSAEAQKKLDELKKKYPQWQLELKEDRDEFPYWMSDGLGAPWRKSVPTPKDRAELADWIAEHPSDDYWNEDDWSDRCRADFKTTAWVLQVLAKRDIWPVDRWRAAIHVWSEAQLLGVSWRYMPRTVLDMPNEAFTSVTNAVGHWLMQEAKVFTGKDSAFFALCQRLIDAHEDASEDAGSELVTRALNAPIGYATQSLFTWWYRLGLKDGIGLETRVAATFTTLMDTTEKSYRLARVFLARQVVSLFRVDEAWTKKYLVPVFDWRVSEDEALVAWTGFLWSPQLFQPLLLVLKQPFLDTAKYFGKLSEEYDSDNYAQILAYTGLDRGGVFTAQEIAAATAQLPQRGLEQALIAVVNALKGAGDKHAEYWRNRVKPYLTEIWPSSKNHKSMAVATRMTQICTSSGDGFAEAVETVHPWLEPVRHNYGLYENLTKNGYCKRFPKEALELLYQTTADELTWLSPDFKKCLDEIAAAAPELANDPRMLRLRGFYEKRGR